MDLAVGTIASCIAARLPIFESAISSPLAPRVAGPGISRRGDQLAIFDAAQQYRTDGVPLIVLAGREYGTGSSRDWAAKGTFLLGVTAVIAASYERIHRSNLVGMGVLPLEFIDGQSWQSLELSGDEVFDIDLDQGLRPRGQVNVRAVSPGDAEKTFPVRVRIDTPVELDYYQNGGILQTVLRKLLKD